MTELSAERNSKVSLGPISETPSAYTERATFVFPGGDAELMYTYEFNGSLRTGGVRFLGVRAYAFRAESECTAWHIEDAYDELVEVANSDWLAGLAAASSDSMLTMRLVRHFMTYIDSVGAFEVAARDYEWIEQQSVSA